MSRTRRSCNFTRGRRGCDDVPSKWYSLLSTLGSVRMNPGHACRHLWRSSFRTCRRARSLLEVCTMYNWWMKGNTQNLVAIDDTVRGVPRSDASSAQGLDGKRPRTFSSCLSRDLPSSFERRVDRSSRVSRRRRSNARRTNTRRSFTRAWRLRTGST